VYVIVLKTGFEQDQDGSAFHPGPARQVCAQCRYDICIPLLSVQ
jgi:MOSC domain-containing protein YiiM